MENNFAETAIESTRNLWDFNVAKKDLFLADGTLVPGSKAIVREDKNVPLAVVSNRYEIVEHKEALKLVLPYMKKFGVPEVKVTLNDSGARMYASFTFKNISTEVARGDIIGLRLGFVNSYNTTTAVKLPIGGLRLLCLNGMTTTENVSSQSFRHTKSQVASITFPDPEEVVAKFNNSAELWKSLTQMGIETNEHRERLINTLVAESSLVNKKREADVTTALEGANTLWDMYNVLTAEITHQQMSSEYYKQAKLARVERNFQEFALELT